MPSRKRPGTRLARLVFLATLGFALGIPSVGEAKGSFFLLELNTGIGESAYASGPLGLTYGLSGGVAWKLKLLPLRWVLLGSIVHRQGTLDGTHDGVSFYADRNDLDLYVAQRSILPVWRFVRAYVEAGVGQRRQSQVIRRGSDLDTLTSSSNELLVIFAAGLQARVSKLFSVGLRGEVAPLDPDPDLAVLAANLAPTRNRAALMGQLGIHF